MNYGDWIKELQMEERAHKEFRNRAGNVRKLYRKDEERGTEFSVLWSNTQILEAALYSQTPTPKAKRRFRDENDVARDASTVLQRSLDFSVDSYDFDDRMEKSVNDFLVCGLGQVRVEYTPFFEPVSERVTVQQETDEEGVSRFVDPDGNEVDPQEDEQGFFAMRPAGEEIAFQEVSCRTVPWSRFRWQPAKDWDGVGWVAEDHYLTEEEVREQLVIHENEVIPLGYNEEGKKSEEKKTEAKYALVKEVWDREERKHFAIIEGFSRTIKFRAGDTEAEDDPLNLRRFWPYPRPMMTNVTAGTVTPIPDYLFYQDQAEELNEVSGRIEKLTQELKWRGVTDGSFAELADVANNNDGEFTPIPNFAARFGETGRGLESVMATMPLTELQQVVSWLVQVREEIKMTIFELTGISDIVRGSTKASETLGAQQLKGQFANMRLSRKQREVQRFIRDIFRIKAEIIAEQFEPEVLELMTGEMVTPQMEQVLESDVLREFNVAIETDSTLLADMEQERQSRIAAAEAVTTLFTSWMPIVQAAPQTLPLATKLATFVLSSFEQGEELEDDFEKLAAPQAVDAPAPVPVPVDGADAGAVPTAGGDNITPIR